MSPQLPLTWVCLLILSISSLATAQPVPVTVTLTTRADDTALPPQFLGVSYEMSELLPKDGKYYFDPSNQALIQTFKTLGIKSLRVGANAVDDGRVAVPQEKDIDVFFNFARAAGVKVIYSFRLKQGDPAESARLAAYIAAHDADVLDCFAIGNEPAFYFPTFEAYFAAWKLHYDAILKVVPNAMFDGPSVAGKNIFAVYLAKAVFPEGHLKMVSDHWYFLGSGRDGEKDPAATRAHFLSDDVHKIYESAYRHVGAVLAAQGVPYRLDEMNSCYHGGAKDSSDTYASTLWALDCTHWWAAHHLLGMNYHTGESVGRDGGFAAPNYAVFLHATDGNGFTMRPLAYALLAFTQGAHGSSLGLNLATKPKFNFNAYAYHNQDGSIYVTLINKSYGDKAQTASVFLALPSGNDYSGVWQKMDVIQSNSDITAKTGITLGGASLDPQGKWAGQWKPIQETTGKLNLSVAPASAAILRFFPKK